jgi:hypothetical protein
LWKAMPGSWGIWRIWGPSLGNLISWFCVRMLGKHGFEIPSLRTCSPIIFWASPYLKTECLANKSQDPDHPKENKPRNWKSLLLSGLSSINMDFPMSCLDCQKVCRIDRSLTRSWNSSWKFWQGVIPVKLSCRIPEPSKWHGTSPVTSLHIHRFSTK